MLMLQCLHTVLKDKQNYVLFQTIRAFSQHHKTYISLGKLKKGDMISKVWKNT